VRNRVALGLLLFLAFTGCSFATSIGLGVADQYDAFIFNNFTGSSSDVTGRLAVGGNVTLTNYSVGSSYASHSSVVTLTAGGNLLMTSGQINGSVIVGGTALLTSATIGGQTTQNAGSLPVNFSYMENYLTNESTILTTTAATGTASLIYGGISLKGNGTKAPQFFSINAGDLASAAYWGNITGVASGSTLVFNVSGSSISLPNVGMSALNGYNVLFNFYNAQSISMSSFDGSVLAPYADITGSWGQIDGTVVAKSWNGTTEFHDLPFKDTTTPSPVPEPSTIVMLSSGMVCLAVWMRRTKKNPLRESR